MAKCKIQEILHYVQDDVVRSHLCNPPTSSRAKRGIYFVPVPAPAPEFNRLKNRSRPTSAHAHEYTDKWSHGLNHVIPNVTPRHPERNPTSSRNVTPRHPERSEGSPEAGNNAEVRRSFTTFRMT